MLFKDGITRVTDKLGTTAMDRDKLKRFFNLAHESVGRFYPWNHLIVDSGLVLIPKYETGTVSWTQGDYKFSGSGNTFTAEMQGRYLTPDGAENSYKIVRVDTSTNEVYVETEIAEASGSGSGFEIVKRFYVLPPEARFIWDVQTFGNKVSNQVNTGLRNTQPRYSDPLQTMPFEPYGQDKYASIYSDGTVSISKDSNVLAGSGTSWMANVRPGYIISVQSKEYRVKRVETNTRIILYNCATEDVSSGSTYEAIPDVSVAILFKETITQKQVVPYSYIRKVFDLVNEDKDRTDFPKEFDEAIIDTTQALIAESDNKSDWATYLQKAQGRLEGLVAEHSPVKPPYMQFPPLVPGGLGR